MRVVAWMAAIWLVAGTAGAWAQEAAEAPANTMDVVAAAFPEGLTPEQVDAIVRFADPAWVQQALREDLTADMAAQEAALASANPGLLAFYGSRLRAVAAAWPALPETIARSFAAPLGTLPPINPWRLVVLSTLLLVCGGIAMGIVAVKLRPSRLGLAARSSEGEGGSVSAAALWLLLDACLVGAFFVGALVFYVVLDPPHPLAPELLSVLCAASLIALVVERGLNFLTAAQSPARGLIGLSVGAGRSFYLVTVVAALLLIVVSAVARILSTVGVPADMVTALVVPGGAIPFLFLIAVVWLRGGRLAEALPAAAAEGRGAAMRNTLSALLTAYLAGVWLLAVDSMFHGEAWVGLHALGGIMLAVLGALLALSLRRALVRYYVVQGSDDDMGRSVTRLMGAVWLVVGFAVVYLNSELWGINLRAHLGVGSAALSVLFNVALVVLVGFVAWSLAVNAIDRALVRTAEAGDPTRAQRLKTLLPLLRRFLQVVILMMIGMVVLSSLGVEIGPLLAGAGVVGIAIGLGAQQTIADIIAGVLFLMDDAFRVGEYVEVGDIRGQVEGISLRCLKLRHHRGAVHTLPFGQIKSLTNYNRDWALMRLEFRVDANTDPALIKRLVKEISKELMADADLGPQFIEPLKSQGIRSVEDGAAIFGVKFVAKPGEQFVIRREAYQRILAAFRQHGIELVGRGVVVKVEGADQHQEKVVAAAASDILEQKGH